jgi:hypothetical protein
VARRKPRPSPRRNVMRVPCQSPAEKARRGSLARACFTVPVTV